MRENRSKGLLSFIDNLTNDIKDELSRKEQQFWNNLSDAQRSALHGLATDETIIIKPADEGGKLVIMNWDDYEKECLSQLENTDFYDKLQSDPNPNYRIEIDRVIDDLEHHDFITEFESQKMKEGNCTPCFYGLPKIHKQYSTFPPLRPICSGYNTCTVKISELIDHCLKPTAQRSSSYVKHYRFYFETPSK